MILRSLPLFGSIALFSTSAGAQCVAEEFCASDSALLTHLAVSGTNILLASEVALDNAPVGFLYDGATDPDPVLLLPSVPGRSARAAALEGSVAVLGLTATPGVPFPLATGAAVIFEELPSGIPGSGATIWIETATLHGRDADFGSLAVAGQGRILIGSHQTLVLFEKLAGSWIETASIEVDVEIVDADFDGDRIAVWGTRDTSPELATFVLENGAWELETQMAFAGEALSDAASVLLKGTRMFASRPEPQSTADEVYELTLTHAGWEIANVISAPLDEQATTLFGTSLDLVGNRLAIGAPVAFDFGMLASPSGTVYIYRLSSNDWQATGAMRLPETATGARSVGTAAAFHPEGVVAIAPGRSCTGSFSDGTSVLLFRGQPCPFEVDELQAAPILGFLGTTPSKFTVEGDGLLNVFEVKVDGVPATFYPSMQELSFWAETDSAGTRTVEFAGPSGSHFADLVVDYLAKPRLELESDIPFKSEVDARVYGTPGELVVLLGSGSAQPSMLPGAIPLLIGDDFSSLFLLGVCGAQGIVDHVAFASHV